MSAAATLTILQEKAIHLLLAGSTVAAATRELGIDRTTFYAWRRSNPAFDAALSSARALQSQILSDNLHDLTSSAVETLRELTAPGSNAPPHVRLRAAQTILKAVAADAHEDVPPQQQHNSTEFDTIRHQQLTSNKIGRNESCPCGSGNKYKRCCGNPVTLQLRNCETNLGTPTKQ